MKMNKKKRGGRRSKKGTRPKPAPVKEIEVQPASPLSKSKSKEAIWVWHRAICFVNCIRHLRNNGRKNCPEVPPENPSMDRCYPALSHGYLLCGLLRFDAVPALKEEPNDDYTTHGAVENGEVGSGIVEGTHHGARARANECREGVLSIAKEKVERSKSRALFVINGDNCLAFAISVSNAINRLPGLVESIFSLLMGHIELQVIFYASFVTEEKIRETLIEAINSGAASIISVHIDNMTVIGDAKSVESYLRKDCCVMKAKVAFVSEAELILTEIKYRTKLLTYYDQLVGALPSWFSKPPLVEDGYNFFTNDRIQTPSYSALSVMPHQHLPHQLLPHQHLPHQLVPHQQFRIPGMINISNHMPSLGGVHGYSFNNSGQNVNHSGTQNNADVIIRYRQYNSYQFHFHN